MKLKRITVFLFSAAIAATLLAGCGGINKEKTVATLNGEPVRLGIANFTARFRQANSDDLYRQLWGENVWATDMFGSGTTMQESFKKDAITDVQDMYTLKLHMEDYGIQLSDDDKASIEKAAEAFMSANTEEAIEALGATEEIVEEYLTLAAIREKMRDAIIADADTQVSDEEAKTSSYSYVQIDKESGGEESAAGEAAETEGTEEPAQDEDPAETAEAFARAAASDGLEAAAEAYEYTLRTGTFTKDDTSIDAEVLETLRKLKEGELSGLIETEDSYYVVRLDAELDKEATEETRESIISERQEAKYNEVLDSYKEKELWELKEKVWEEVTFDNLFTLTPPEDAQAAAGTETAIETETETDTETAEDLEAATE